MPKVQVEQRDISSINHTTQIVSKWSLNPFSRTGSATVCGPELTCEAVDLIDRTRQDSLRVFMVDARQI
ncbi:hypothetical protein Y032_0053g2388 [Ancylostoma ceylanicum]|uniref:Uncharacterized protein n=1 Tax=Ancylostoma ceylanicum TaxID=53326 RepID=A0A016U7Q2_9BILA|nr:hypothetical protein Y032_0053g2388 [Ancylostoma ceylanicum]